MYIEGGFTMARKYTPEFKADAIRYFEDHPDMDNHKKAEYLGVPYHTLYGWIKEHRRKERAGEAEPVTGNLIIPLSFFLSKIRYSYST